VVGARVVEPLADVRLLVEGRFGDDLEAGADGGAAAARREGARREAAAGAPAAED
jgi:hypothetical protein